MRSSYSVGIFSMTIIPTEVYYVLDRVDNETICLLQLRTPKCDFTEIPLAIVPLPIPRYVLFYFGETMLCERLSPSFLSHKSIFIH